MNGPQMPLEFAFLPSEVDFIGPLFLSNGLACLLEWLGLKSTYRQTPLNITVCLHLIALSQFPFSSPCPLPSSFWFPCVLPHSSCCAALSSFFSLSLELAAQHLVSLSFEASSKIFIISALLIVSSLPLVTADDIPQITFFPQFHGFY